MSRIVVTVTPKQYEEFLNWCFMEGINRTVGAKIIWGKGSFANQLRENAKMIGTNSTRIMK